MFYLFNHPHCRFRGAISGYVDSHNRAETAQAWPLVKVCRIQHRWPLLAGGAVLVDLPGTRDANLARGAVAEAYLKRCNAVWIVADITRAVDNRTAKDLLGQQFRCAPPSSLEGAHSVAPTLRPVSPIPPPP